MILKKDKLIAELKLEHPDLLKINPLIFEKVVDSYYVILREDLENVTNLQIEISELGRFLVRRRKLNILLRKLIARYKKLRNKTFKEKNKELELSTQISIISNLCKRRDMWARIMLYGKEYLKSQHKKQKDEIKQRV